MADILSSQTTVPSLYTQTESAANLVVDSSSKKNFSSQQTNNKYNGHVRRLRNVFTDQSLNIDKQQSKASNNSSSRTMTIDPLPIKKDFSSHHRRYSPNEQHYDFPADAVEQLKKQQRDDNDGQTIIPSLLPANVFKRMNHLNTTFVKPTKIESTLPKLIFEQTKPTNKEFKRTELLESPVMNGKDSITLKEIFSSYKDVADISVCHQTTILMMSITKNISTKIFEKFFFIKKMMPIH